MIRRHARARKTKTDRRSRARLLRALAACDSNPAEMLELYYWSKEPGFATLIRAIATMPEDARAALEAFFALARDTKSVAADLDPHGVLTFCSPEAARSVALAVCAMDELDDMPQLLN